MAVFFLLIGLELERELYVGKLSQPRKALLPAFAALGGMLVPALIHHGFNRGLPTQAGFGIPMATDIAFALGILALLGSRVPAALRVFLAAYAVMDDLGAVLLIAAFYTSGLSPGYLALALACYAALIALNRFWRVDALAPYLAGGALMWFLMLKSGVHPTLAGVLLAFAIPFRAGRDGRPSPSDRLAEALHKPVAFVILPLFALANTGVLLGDSWLSGLASANAAGIALGLLAGKPLGVMLFCLAAISSGLCAMPSGMGWRHVAGAGILGGIGFTMSIFVTNLAFAGDPETIDGAKLAVLLASLGAGVLGLLWLRFGTKSRGD